MRSPELCRDVQVGFKDEEKKTKKNKKGRFSKGGPIMVHHGKDSWGERLMDGDAGGQVRIRGE